jgi:hypothetical protein
MEIQHDKELVYQIISEIVTEFVGPVQIKRIWRRGAYEMGVTYLQMTDERIAELVRLFGGSSNEPQKMIIATDDIRDRKEKLTGSRAICWW